MVHILLNNADFYGDYAYQSLVTYLKPDSRVTILALENDEGWASEADEWDYQFDRGGKSREKIIASFKRYGIRKLQWFHQYQDTAQSFLTMLENTDVLYVCGSNPEHMMFVLKDMKIADAIQKFEGVLITDSAGAEIMMDQFDSAWDDEKVEGLSILKGFSLMPSYVEDVLHLSRIIREIEVYGKTVFAYWKEGGLILNHGHYELIGNSFIASDEDLDRIYQAYEDAKSRQEYYGSNTIWD